MKTISGRTCSARAETSQSIGLVRIYGVVTAPEVGRLISAVAAWSKPAGVLVSVVDYSRAMVAIDEEGLLQAAAEAKARGTEMTPAAILVNADQMASFRAYCARSMEHGVLRVAFSLDQQEQARRWAARQAAVREHWRAVRLALQSG